VANHKTCLDNVDINKRHSDGVLMGLQGMLSQRHSKCKSRPRAEFEAKNLGGSIVYRYVARPNTLYLNMTNRCTNCCSFCVKNYSSGLSGYRLQLDREPSTIEICGELQHEIKESDSEVVFCGFGEPTMRLDMALELTRTIKKQYPHLKIRLNTDGLAQLRNKDRKVAKELREAGMDSVSISLNAESQEKYDLLCRPSLEGAYRAVLDFARECKRYLHHVTLTALDLEDIDLSECRRIAKDLGCEFRVR